MRITLQELQLHPVRFNVDIPAGEIEFDNKVTQSSALVAEGVAELVSYSLADIRLRGTCRLPLRHRGSVPGTGLASHSNSV